MSTEFGLFNDEGCVANQFYSRHEAEAFMLTEYEEDDELHVAEICPEHEEQERDTCEECNAEEE